jgi:stage II sporulation protein D
MRRLLLAIAPAVIAIGLILPQQGEAGTLFLVDGRGWGHGVGMSQYGADGYAHAGWGYKRILKHYYRGTELRVVPARPVRVLLAQGLPAVKISSTKPFRVVDARGKARTLKAGRQNLAPPRLAKLKLKLPLRYEPGAAPLQLDGKAYRGALLVHRRGGTLTIVNSLPLDRYLRGVVPWEMPEDWHPQALRAQAVVARSYALAKLVSGTLFDVYPDTRSQVYGGIEAEEDSTNRAIGATAGRVLTWRGRVATTFYHSASGGRTSSNAEVWGGSPVPYLVSVPDPYGWRSKHNRWGPFRLTPEDVGRSLGASAVRDLVVTRGPSGRAIEVTIKGAGGTRKIRSDAFRRALDLRSTWFSVRVLHLEEAASRALASAGPTAVLRGFIRGLGKVRLEQQVNGGTWRTVEPVRPQANGRFRITVKPTRTTSYRLATRAGAGGAITVKPR